MPDAMQVYKDIAKEHGVNPNDKGAVTHFFEVTVQSLPNREEIFERILSESTGLDVAGLMRDAAQARGNVGPAQSMPNTPDLD